MCVLQLRDGADVSRFQFWHLCLRLALENEQVAEALRGLTGAVEDGRIRAKRAGDHPQHRDPSREGIGDRLPHTCHVGAGAHGLDCSAVAVLCDGGVVANGRRRYIADESVEHRLDADHVQAGGANQREQPACGGGRSETGKELVLRQRSFREERLHQAFVGFGDRLDQALACFAGLIGQRGGHVGLRHLPAVVADKGQRPHPDEVHDSNQAALLADW